MFYLIFHQCSNTTVRTSDQTEQSKVLRNDCWQLPKGEEHEPSERWETELMQARNQNYKTLKRRNLLAGKQMPIAENRTLNRRYSENTTVQSKVSNKERTWQAKGNETPHTSA